MTSLLRPEDAAIFVYAVNNRARMKHAAEEV
jgi:hypothetical protein